jgi:hypothetical protein
MSHLTRTLLILTLVMLPVGAIAQESGTAAPATQTTTQTTTTTAAAPAVPEGERPSPGAVREKFILLIDRHPDQVGRLLSIDPTLVSNEPFMARYPDLAQFVAANPEVRRNPHYFVRSWAPEPRRQETALERIIEALSIAFVFLVVAFALAWLVRTIIEQRRWSRLSKTQTEVHNKILDRFSTSQELLEYVRTSAGTKFLESAPIPVRVERPGANTSMSRILWSIQTGVVLAVGSLGMLLVSLRFDGESAHGFFAIGVIAFCIGAGFIASAVVSLFLSRRLGLPEIPELNQPGS